MDVRGTPLDVRESFAGKVVVLLAVTVVVTAGVGGIIYATVGDQIRADTEESLQTNTKLEAQQLDGWFELTTEQTETLPRAVAFRSEDTFQISDHLHQLTTREPIAGAYYLNRNDGRPLASAGTDVVRTDDDRLVDGLRERADRLLAEGSERVTYSEPFRGSASEEPRVLIVGRTPSREDRALLVLVDLDKLSDRILGTAPASSTEQVRVLDEDGTVVLSRDRDELLTEFPVDSGRYGDESGVLDAQLDGTGATIGYARSDSLGWTTVHQVETAEAFSLQSTVSRQILLLLGVLLVCLTVIGLVLGRRTVTTVRDLADRAQALRAGDLETPIESDRRDEFGDLYRSFDAMRESLRERIRDVERERERADVARQEVLDTNRYLQSRAEDTSRVMAAAAGGDLTRRMAVDGQHDAMDAIAESFNEMMTEIERAIGQLQSFADHVEESGRVVGTSAGNIRDASERVAEGVQRIHVDADRWREELDEATVALDDAADAMESSDFDRARDRLDDLAARLSDVAEGTSDTMAEAETISGAAEEQAAELTEVSTRADELVRYVEPLRDVLAGFEADAEHEFVFGATPTVEDGTGSDD